MRQAVIARKTVETQIELTFNLDGSGDSKIDIQCGFLEHMLALFARHGRFDIVLACRGDHYVDDHHTVEDIGICLGTAFLRALGNKRGITRYGSAILPMDEALIMTAVDLSGRGCLGWDMRIPAEKVGKFDTELVKEFWLAFTRCAACSLHFRQIAGENSHHIIEGAFKSAALSLRAAAAIEPGFAGEIPSTKGAL